MYKAQMLVSCRNDQRSIKMHNLVAVHDTRGQIPQPKPASPFLVLLSTISYSGAFSAFSFFIVLVTLKYLSCRW